jgi:hypothetical protein
MVNATLFNKVSQLYTLCTQLQAQLNATRTEDPLLPWLREATADWTREEAVHLLLDLHTLPDDLSTIRLPLLKHLHVTFGLDRSDAQADNNRVLRLSAANGHLDVLKYLKEAFGLDKSDAQADDNFALRWSANNGHLDVLKYLKEAFGLEQSDAQVVNKSQGPRPTNKLIALLKLKRPAA